MFVWRSNLLGSSGKGHEYFLKHLLGTTHGVLGKDLGAEGGKPKEAVWHEHAPEGKLDLLVTLDFRMSTTCVYSDIVLPTATWYEKNDLNTSDMHPFIHPLTGAVDPAWEARSRLGDLQGHRQGVLRVAPKCSASRRTSCSTRSSTTRPTRSRSPSIRKDWKKGECEPIPGKTMPVGDGGRARLSQPLRALHRARAADGEVGNGIKGMAWKTGHEVEHLKALNGVASIDGPTKGMARIVTDIDAAETILMLAPETNGEVAVRPGKRSARPRAASTPISPCRRRTRRSASATWSRSRARSSRRRPGRGSRARRSATTPATPTCTN
jgi:nitrate reductase alpha subunit